MAIRNALTRRLLEEDCINTGDNTVSKFGIDQILNVQSALQERLTRYDPSHGTYNPLFEIAKLGLSTQNDDLAFKCHSKIAEFLHPQVKSIEINAKEDKEVKITVELAGYARRDQAIEVEPEDIETDGDVDAEEHDYQAMVLGDKTKDLNS